jgi:hypothetical protein
MFRTIFAIFGLVGMVMAQTCPLRCPSCMKCDPEDGTCSLPRDFVSCSTKTRPALPGYCYAGVCNAQLSLSPVVTSLKSCQLYSCLNNVCTLKNKPDGTDCTVEGAELHSVCVTGVCKPVVFALSETFPLQNIGCLGQPDNVQCDTNDILNDMESCQSGVCKFPDGSYYGYVPAPPAP